MEDPTKGDFILNKGAVICGFRRLPLSFLSPLDMLVAEMMQRARDAASQASGEISAEREAGFR